MPTSTRGGTLRIVVSGMVAGDPFHGGATWAVLQYVLGFRRLGHDVLLVEPVAELRARSVAYFHSVVRAFGLGGRAALLVRDSRETAGATYARLRKLAAGADLLVNVGGMLRDETLVGAIPTRAYLDLDPAFNQLWHAVEGIDVGFARHTHHVTVGLAIGRPGCNVPTAGLEWTTTFQPVVLELWQPRRRCRYEGLTTVGNWRSYGPIEHQGVVYGQKAHSFRELFELPARVPVHVFAALGIHPDEERDLAALRANGWRLLDPVVAAGTPGRYRRFVRGSWAELGVAKTGYVAARCGWFSDRSACYLAAGRPVVAQETGFSDFLPTGEGLLSFATVDEAVAAIETLHADYGRHARAARELAEERFDSDKVLARLIDAVGAA